nr:protein FAR1-RELATED SEQUENCE 5-like [Ipomoea trifida]
MPYLPESSVRLLLRRGGGWKPELSAEDSADRPFCAAARNVARRKRPKPPVSRSSAGGGEHRRRQGRQDAPLLSTEEGGGRGEPLASSVARFLLRVASGGGTSRRRPERPRALLCVAGKQGRKPVTAVGAHHCWRFDVAADLAVRGSRASHPHHLRQSLSSLRSPSPAPPISSAQARRLLHSPLPPFPLQPPTLETILNMEPENLCSDGNDETDEAFVDEQHLTCPTVLYNEGCVNENEFENCWKSMVSKYGLEDHALFRRLYELKEKWCTALSKDFFSAGTLTSQRSESTNHAIGFNAKKTTSLMQFYKIFKETVKRWTKFAKSEIWDRSHIESGRPIDYINWRHEMSRKYYALVLKCQGNDEAKRILEDGYNRDFVAINALMCSRDSTKQGEDIVVSSSSNIVLDPTRSTTKGRKQRIKDLHCDLF